MATSALSRMLDFQASEEQQNRAREIAFLAGMLPRCGADRYTCLFRKKCSCLFQSSTIFNVRSSTNDIRAAKTTKCILQHA